MNEIPLTVAIDIVCICSNSQGDNKYSPKRNNPTHGLFVKHKKRINPIIPMVFPAKGTNKPIDKTVNPRIFLRLPKTTNAHKKMAINIDIELPSKIPKVHIPRTILEIFGSGQINRYISSTF